MSDIRAIPSVPILSLGAFAGHGATLPALDDAPAVQPVTSGRIAIGMALRALGVGPGDKVLVPAYHSPSMIPPVHWRGAEVVFYRVHPDTTADLDDVASKLGPGVKAVMVTHFFGFPQDLRALRALCDSHAAGLVEDCAHCFFGERDGVAVGASGDYAIGSSMKFFPIFEGGCLVSHRHRLPAALHGAGAGFEAKAALGALEASFAQGRLPLLRAALALPLRLKTALWNRLKARSANPGAGAAPALAPASSDSSFDFDPRWVDRRSSWFSRAVLRRAGRARLVGARRRNYLELERALAGAPGWQPLFAALPAGACPWVFPLLADRPDALFERLRAAGVPMVRFGASLWPGVDATVCANSVALGRCLFGLPVHQALRAPERAWLAATVRRALEETAGAAS
ncbi:aminotransferase class I/II-fold pyridoxal phosphate-dependent enzyme [Massilia timonae]|uniref:Aminotransferase class I and II family protein n=1 Tax=Massilia timonae TaxID=47229 RepID=A0A1S2NC88_9BURK|nr:aminotransferase class I/II-fold pyridoxal phosphate-dependent enzyme [Massilia timonae]OIJ42463.1 aminotransferase class I and II family protein [Massilia timonae]